MPLQKTIRYLVPVLLYCLLIFTFSAQPAVGVSNDKLIHVLAFAGMGFLFFRFFKSRKLSFREAYAFAVLFTILYGIGDEVHQFYVPGRSSDVFDILADSIGAILGAPLYELFYRLQLTKTSSSS